MSLHCKVTPETTGIINAETIGKMKQESFLINTARGVLVNEDDLIHALEEKRIAGAAMDTIAVEPIPEDHPFIHISIYPEVTFSYWKRRLSPETLDRVEVVPLNNMTEAKLVLGYKKQRRLSALDHLFVDLVRNISYFNLT